MNPIPEFEHKFVLTPDAAAALLERVRPHLSPIEFDAARPEAWTRTTYLDTSDLRYLRSSETPTHRRLRVREYAAAPLGGPPVLTGRCFIELKENTGSVRTKIRCEAPSDDILALLRGEVPSGRNADARTSAAWLAILKRVIEERPLPQVTTWYRRESHGARGVRITFDSNVTFCDPGLPGHAGEPATPGRVLERIDSTVVEVKLTGAAPAWLAPALLEKESHGFSKFQRAMQAVAADRMAARGGSR